MPLIPIPCTLMRGGTSKGAYFLASDLPQNMEARDRTLLAVMGSPDPRQIDGIGGAVSLTSKVAIIGPSTRPGAEVDYLFAQVSVDKALVDTSPSCGNILAGVGPFAIEAGLVSAQDGETSVRIQTINTGGLVEARVRTPGGSVEYEGDAAVDGVPGTAAPIYLDFTRVAGCKTGSLLPTGRIRETIEGVEVSCIDAAVPMVLMRAEDVGETGYESKDDLDRDLRFFARVEAIRQVAGARMGLGDVSASVIPKIGLLAPPRFGGSVTSRYLVPHSLHAAHAVTGAICVATCCALAGSVADGVASVARTNKKAVTIEHPSGSLQILLETEGQGADIRVLHAGLWRTARKLFSGQAFIPQAAAG